MTDVISERRELERSRIGSSYSSDLPAEFTARLFEETKRVVLRG